jgi:beta-galactosidase
MPEFAVGERDFLLDGRPIQLLSGALHYFRVHPDYWADRIDKARRMGLNTIETYIAWNAHAPKPGVFDLGGGLDLDRFLRLIAAAGMYAIVRPGPYICAEWDNGGLPTWLFRDSAVGVRRYEPRYLAAVRDYLHQALAVVAPHQIDRGGPVVLVQIENEYGAYGNDPDYLAELVDYTRDAGITVPLTTVDQANDEMLAAGGIDGVLRTASFGSRSADRLATLRAHQPAGPLMCSEFWDGWFDHWGGPHHTTSVTQAAADLDAMLAAGASVNLYMFHGGTNFGFTNGANDKGVYRPLTTSYDYDAPLDEAGRPTAKYHAFRSVIARYREVPEPPLPPAAVPEFVAPLRDPVPLLDAPERWGTWRHHEVLPTLDDLDPPPRLALLRTSLREPAPGVLVFGEIRDRAMVFLDGRPVAILHREHNERALPLPHPSGELTIVLEDQGRVNYGPRIGEPKGIIGGATLRGRPLTGWDVLPLDLTTPPNPWPPDPLPPPDGPVPGPLLLRTEFTLDAPTDLYLSTHDWGKGMAWLNGAHLGRYWHRGPQRTLYIPAPLTTSGSNTLVVFETEALIEPTARFVAHPDLGPREAM